MRFTSTFASQLNWKVRPSSPVNEAFRVSGSSRDCKDPALQQENGVLFHASLQLLEQLHQARSSIRYLLGQLQRLNRDQQLTPIAHHVLSRELMSTLSILSTEQLHAQSPAYAGLLRITTPESETPAEKLHALFSPSEWKLTKTLMGSEDCVPPKPKETGKWRYCAVNARHTQLEIARPHQAQPVKSTKPADRGLRPQVFSLYGSELQVVTPALLEEGSDSNGVGRCFLLRLMPQDSPSHVKQPVKLLIEVPNPPSNVNSWIAAIEHASARHLYALDRQLQAVRNTAALREVLHERSRLTLPVSWLHRCLHSEVPANSRYHEAHLSRSLSMGQVLKDLAREQILLDHQKLDATRHDVQDSYHRLMKMLFTRCISAISTPTSGIRTKDGNDDMPVQSPTNRLTASLEAKSLAFVERVLRGSSRTQAGGDMYDAIRYLVNRESIPLVICPTSNEVSPIQFQTYQAIDEGEFRVTTFMEMQFRLVVQDEQSASFSTDEASGIADWAIIRASWRREFVFGVACDEGVVELDIAVI